MGDVTSFAYVTKSVYYDVNEFAKAYEFSKFLCFFMETKVRHQGICGVSSWVECTFHQKFHSRMIFPGGEHTAPDCDLPTPITAFTHALSSIEEENVGRRNQVLKDTQEE